MLENFLLRRLLNNLVAEEAGCEPILDDQPPDEELFHIDSDTLQEHPDVLLILHPEDEEKLRPILQAQIDDMTPRYGKVAATYIVNIHAICHEIYGRLGRERPDINFKAEVIGFMEMTKILIATISNENEKRALSRLAATNVLRHGMLALQFGFAAVEEADKRAQMQLHTLAEFLGVAIKHQKLQKFTNLPRMIDIAQAWPTMIIRDVYRHEI